MIPVYFCFVCLFAGVYKDPINIHWHFAIETVQLNLSIIKHFRNDILKYPENSKWNKGKTGYKEQARVKLGD